jgi:hypothetical protein
MYGTVGEKVGIFARKLTKTAIFYLRLKTSLQKLVPVHFMFLFLQQKWK